MMNDIVTLHCVRQGSKLRIRFHSFTNADGKVFTNVYNNSYNCQFPRDIRQEGRFYQIASDDVVLVDGNARQPFYRIRSSNLRIVEGPGGEVINASSVSQKKPDAKGKKSQALTTRDCTTSKPEQVFEVLECVICMSTTPDTIFLPCAHLCCCVGCHADLKSRSLRPTCPLCRRTILNAIPN